MKKDFDKKLKELFDFQKFEDDPKLKQVIKDSLKDSSFKISDFELSEILGGNGTVLRITDCPSCKNKKCYLVFREDNTVHKVCTICGYSE